MDIDLDPKEWKSERDKPVFPVFGPKAPEFFAWLVGFGATVLLLSLAKVYLF